MENGTITFNTLIVLFQVVPVWICILIVINVKGISSENLRGVNQTVETVDENTWLAPETNSLHSIDTVTVIINSVSRDTEDPDSWQSFNALRFTEKNTPSWYDAEKDATEDINVLKVFYLHVDNCSNDSAMMSSVQKYDDCEPWQLPKVWQHECTWKVTVESGHFISILAEDLTTHCWHSPYALEISDKEYNEALNLWFRCDPSYFSVFVSDRQYVYFRLWKLGPKTLNAPNFKVYFQTSNDDYRSKLSVFQSSPTTGVLSPWRFDGRDRYPCWTNASYDLSVPSHHVVVVSFRYFYMDLEDVKRTSCEYNRIQLFVLSEAGEKYPIMQACSSAVIPTRVYNSSLKIVFKTLGCSPSEDGKGFKMLFSFLIKLRSPVTDKDGKFDCSLPDYDSFRQHLDCNLEPECQGGEDERADCPYSSPACNGAVATTNKCYTYHKAATLLTWYDAQKECQKMGGDLAMMKTEKEWQDFEKLFQFGKNLNMAWIGLYTGSFPLGTPYRFMLKWVDNSIALNFNNSKPFGFSYGTYHSRCATTSHNRKLDFCRCLTPRRRYNFVCETKMNTTDDIQMDTCLFPSVSEITLSRLAVNLTLCSSGHWTQSFMASDPLSYCNVQNVSHTLGLKRAGFDITVAQRISHASKFVRDLDVMAIDITSSVYVCEDRKSVVPYTLACDFKRDCQDGSDENFCRHTRNCWGEMCKSGQCILNTLKCDGKVDCWDGSDEDCRDDFHSNYALGVIPITYRLLPPVVIDYNIDGGPSQTLLEANESCPDTHIRCPEGYCLPVYVRCNGVVDCPGREDEVDCHSFTCPGFYRCRASRVCVHVQHMCDGWPQCPQHDDELMCHITCPSNCSCQGLSFFCPRPFTAHTFPDLRYLDATGSGIIPERLTQNIYLVWLCLRSCGLRRLPIMNFPNLRTLDISDNRLASVKVNGFLTLANLRTLRLSGNPLVSLFNEYTHLVHDNLTVLDLSYTRLRTLDSTYFSSYPKIKSLNISFSSLDTITDSGFTHMHELVELDLRGSHVQTFPVHVMTNLSQLSVVYTDNYRLCCRDFMPDHLDSSHCVTSADVLSTCHDLLNSDSLRIALWTVSVLALAGNCGCLLYRCLFSRSAVMSAFSVFLTNLNLSDFGTGVYLAIIGATDTVYRGSYSSSYTAWTSSVTCSSVGFLCVLSNQVSALVLILITFDRFLAICQPASRVRFTRLSALVSCGIAWFVGFITATIPLLPVMSEWQFYRQSGICIPLPVTRKSFGGRNYAFSVMVVFNLALFLLIAVGQVFIYITLYSSDTVAIETNNKSLEHRLARRVVLIVLTEFVYWCFAGFVSVLDFATGKVPNAVHTVLYVVLFPLNSALNPCLYLLSVVMEKRRLARNQRLMDRLARRLVYHSADPSRISSVNRTRIAD